MANTQPLASVLLIDSDQQLSTSLLDSLESSSLTTTHVLTLQEGVVENSTNGYEIVILRDRLSDGLASEAIADLQACENAPELIIFTTSGDPKEAAKALKAGVWDYIIDPFPDKTLPSIAHRALRYRNNKVESTVQRLTAMSSDLRRNGIIGGSKIMQNCVDLTVRIAESDANVLIDGESGTGKELFAATIHNLSARAENNFAIVDCAALPSALAESILFGHSKGAFTGADKEQPGLIPQAHRGTLFLDEIGELPLDIQKKFLRIIQERTYLPIGTTKEKKIDFRLIAATNKDLQAMIDEGTFREDLLFRIKTFHLALPSLRSRVADIAELAYHCRDKFCKREKIKKKTFSPDYLLVLTRYDWPGNVRELFQAVERSIIDARESSILYPIHLPPAIRIQVAHKKLWQNQKEETPQKRKVRGQKTEDALPSLKQSREKAVFSQEKIYLKKLLSLTNGDIKKCCHIAAVSRSRLYGLLKKHELSARDYAPGDDICRKR
ncbi:sigma-54-dependent transcriptional regulator [Desulfogranum japonicum]|uniref:sigma-54-dependent transcriptional regulator n=1 Tax=Desulfogranum japonicum TaxID=231447 RepID=UPI0004150224|nr:sigma-54 dependent transcriptional regulator [Desulfogranum japonicum]